MALHTSTNRSYGGLALILAVLLVIVTYLWVTARSDLRNATAEFRGDVATYSSEIIRTCKLTPTTTPQARNECEQAFESFGATFKEYGKTIVALTSTTTEEDPLEVPPVTTPATTSSGTVLPQGY